jgi:hypothetical protein
VVDEIRIWLPRHLPGYVVRSIAKLGEGSDNVVYEVNGALIIRGSKEADPASRSESTRRGAASCGVRVVHLAGTGADLRRHRGGRPRVLSAPWPSPDGSLGGRTRAAGGPHGRFLSRLHQAPVEKVEELVERDTYPLLAWREDAQRDYREIVEQVPGAARRLIEDFPGPSSCRSDRLRKAGSSA